MKKKYITLSICIIFAIIMSIAYFLISNDTEETPIIDELNTGNLLDEEYKYKLINEESENIEYIKLDGSDFVEIIPDLNNDGKWLIKGFEDVILNQSNIQSIVSSFSLFGTNQKIESENINLSEYGLDNPSAKIRIKAKNGEEKTIIRGNTTPDNSYYYVSIDGDNSVYMIEAIDGNRFTYTMDNFIDKSIDKVSVYAITYLDVIQRDRDEIEIEYTQNKSGNASELMSIGMETLEMKKPIAGAVVYPTNLQETILSKLSDIELGELIEIYPEDLSKYGLDNPRAEITAKDAEHSIYIKVGNEDGNGKTYCTVNNKSHVFLINEAIIDPFINTDIYKFIEKFVGLHYRADIKGADIKYDDKLISITFGGENDENNKDENNQRFTDNRKSYINGKEIEKEKFSEFYELVIGITFDNIDTSAVPTGNPEVTIKYLLKDDTIDEIKFYNYNDSFYLADNSRIKGALVNKQSVNTMLKKAELL